MTLEVQQKPPAMTLSTTLSAGDDATLPTVMRVAHQEASSGRMKTSVSRRLASRQGRVVCAWGKKIVGSTSWRGQLESILFLCLFWIEMSNSNKRKLSASTPAATSHPPPKKRSFQSSGNGGGGPTMAAVGYGVTFGAAGEKVLPPPSIQD
jgi:hypothetical protein